jgi:DUF1680 family protein
MRYLILLLSFAAAAGGADTFRFNRPPLEPKPFAELPLGAIEARGWLHQQLKLMAAGMTGRLDEVYGEVVGRRNAWLGGDGDAWERGPYWVDGLLPLAHILKDAGLQAKVRPWIEWTLANQRADGYIGPLPTAQPAKPEPGLQKDREQDWWPRMVMLKILQQHYMATGDRRAIDCLTRYFRYQARALPSTPLGHWSYWGTQRGGDNLLVVLWLYNQTGEKFLLDLAELVHSQTHPFTTSFLEGLEIPRWRAVRDTKQFAFHCVNLGQGIKEPVVYYQLHPEPKHLEAVSKAFADIETHHGQPHGLFAGDEGLHGRSPTQGSELCTAVETMYSLEKMLEITGNTAFADRLEKIAYNMLPTQISDDFMTRQYFQQANQVMLTHHPHNFFNNNDDGIVFGLTSGYTCCTANLHQGWPKFTQHLWMASRDGGLAALVYAPSRVTAEVAGGKTVTITEETDYPFDEVVRFRIETAAPVEFPLHLRIPAWAKGASVAAQGNLPAGTLHRIARTWRNGDTVELRLPMEFRARRWHESSVGIERGPLVLALKIGEAWSDKKTYREVRPTTPWNYALPEAVVSRLSALKIERRAVGDAYPWNLENAPLTVRTEGIRHPSWDLYNEMAGPLPWSPQRAPDGARREPIELIPYGCTTLRISAFPTVTEPRAP